MSVAAATIARALADARRDNARLRAAIEAAVDSLRLNHRSDGSLGRREQCLVCSPQDGHWPCVAAEIADDLRAALS